ncbi:MAG: serine hydrolase domain-containing protein [Bacteroidota bacterium]
MKKIIESLLALTLVGVLLLSCTKEYGTERKHLSWEIRQALEDSLDVAMHEENVPGVIVGVWTPDGNWIVARGVSNLVTGEPMDVDNHFRIGSVTKTFTGTVVLKLVDEGKISLDSTLAYYLPQYAFPEADKITVRMLGNMSAGIYDFIRDWPLLDACCRLHWDVQFSADSLVKVALQHPLNFEPGTQYGYSNTNTVLLGLICQKVTGKPIDQLMEEMIFIPYELNNTSWPHNNYLPVPYSKGYTRATVNNVFEEATYYNVSWADAAGILISNIYDLKKWVRLLASGELYSAAMQVERLNWNPASYNGYGFAIMNASGNPDNMILGHDGAVWGFNTYAVHLPNYDITVIVSVNFYGGVSALPADDIAMKVIGVLVTNLENESLLKSRLDTRDIR